MILRKRSKKLALQWEDGQGGRKERGDPYGFVSPQCTKDRQDLKLSAAIALGLKLEAKRVQVGASAEKKRLAFFCSTLQGPKPCDSWIQHWLIYLQTLFYLITYPMKFVPLYPFYR